MVSVKLYLASFYNKIQIAAIVLFVIGFLSGLAGAMAKEEFYQEEFPGYLIVAGTILIAASIILFYFQIFQFYVIHSYLGPKVIMVYHMV